jgi:hypothetical protein
MAALILCAASLGSAQLAEPSAASAAVAPRNPIPTAQVLELSAAMTDLRRSHLTNLSQMEDAVGGAQRDAAEKIQTLATEALYAEPPTLGRGLFEEIRELHFKLSLASFV